jgi:serine/threonine-protein kinase RsbW
MEAEYVLELPNDVRSIEGAVEFLMERTREAGFELDRIRLNFRVGLTEALANAILYGNSRDPAKRVRIEARVDRESVKVRVTDEGRGFDPNRIPDPTLPRNRARPGGRGLFLIRQLMDEVEFNERGNSITMILYRSRSQPEGTS